VAGDRLIHHVNIYCKHLVLDPHMVAIRAKRHKKRN
jgi:hypothetical protein